MSTFHPEDRRAARGFTLIEMLAAILILSVGLTALLGAFGSGVATEQEAELVRDGSRLVEIVRDRIVNEGLLGHDGEALPQPVREQKLAGYPGLAYDLDFEPTPDRPDELIVHIKVRWLTGGQAVTERYSFALARGRPLHLRIRELNERGSGK